MQARSSRLTARSHPISKQYATPTSSAERRLAFILPWIGGSFLNDSNLYGITDLNIAVDCAALEFDNGGNRFL
jgi:hypothetical protein